MTHLDAGDSERVTLAVAELIRRVTGSVLTGSGSETYARDQSPVAVSGRAGAVVLAESVEDVVATLDVAGRHGLAVVPRGAGTGLAGGANALDGCIVLSFERMNRILDIDPRARIARVQPGVINADLNRAAAEHGLFYAPDPGSREISSLGGNIATNAGGMCCAKYGVTRNHVLALTSVLADGRIIRTGATTRKNVAGLDLTQLLIGSEGTLAVIVEATLSLQRRPTSTSTVAATFPSVRDAVDTVLGLDYTAPAVAEIMDRTTVASVNSMTRMGLDESAGAVLLIQYDGADAAGAAQACTEIAHRNGAIEAFSTDDPREGSALMQARSAAYPALERLGTTLLDDVCVPVNRLPDLVDRIDSIGTEHALTIGTFGHAADGNLHPTIVYDAADPDSVTRAWSAFEAIVEAAVHLDGSVTGEHGIGSLKTELLGRMLGPAELDVMRAVKAALDPHGILNPGRGF